MNNRIFKFRVWDKLAKHMIYPDKGYQGHYILDLNGRFHNLQKGSNGDDYIVQQYTGLNDSKGNEIFEGDIIKEHHFEDWGDKIGHDYFGIVVYKAHSDNLSFAGYKTIPINNQNTNFIGNAIQSDCEVIGNQFELPCSKPGSFDNNGECWVCDGWATDCPFIKTRKLEIKSDKSLMPPLNTNYKLDIHDKPSN